MIGSIGRLLFGEYLAAGSTPDAITPRIDREVLRQVLRMHDVGGKLLNGIKNMYINSLASIRVNRVKGGESECFRMNSGVRKGCIMPLCI